MRALLAGTQIGRKPERGLTPSCEVERCVAGITANRERCLELVERSLAMVTALAPKIGYDAAAAIAKESVATGKTVRELCVEKQILPPAELAAILDPHAQTEGGIVEGASAGG